MKFNLEGKIFVSISNADNGDVDDETLFYYHQDGDVVTGHYEGGSIVKGHLIARMLSNGQLDMRYQHLNKNGDIMIGKCLSTPEVLADGRLKLKEQWQWLSGDMSTGYSEVQEVDRA